MNKMNENFRSMRLGDQDGSVKKIGPAVQPKPEQQEQAVPKSYTIGGVCKPSYTKPLLNDTMPVKTSVYSNISSNPHSFTEMRHSIPQNERVTYSNIQVGGKNTGSHTYSNVNTYSNVPPYRAHCDALDDFPPPPPELSDYGQCSPNACYPPPPDEFPPPPPSPVSSSYSELRRATQFESQPFQPDYGNYGISSRGSSTYESIYEPINPRTPSEVSSRSNYSLYESASTTGVACEKPKIASQQKQFEEAEVDTLTDLLVNSLDSSSSCDIDAFGICCKCHKKVLGEGEGCTAMGKVYHISCFTCCHCDTRLEGKPFYNLEGNPYCEQGYVETLEKCSVCLKPILNRILRATGRPYHPQCFNCIVCGKNLDGITFTVDATNHIHCIEDFHKKFAPRCCVCKQPIMPDQGEEETVRIVALDRSFHIGCYKCEDCGLVLSTEAEGRGCYPLDDHILCKSCNAKRVQALTSVMTTEL